METVTGDEHVPRFDCSREALLLDIDGTLLDIAPTPDSVTVPRALVSAIRTLFERTSGAVAFVSGRRLSVIDELFAPLNLAAVGCHGGEFRARPSGEVFEEILIPESIKRRIAEIAELAPGVRIEDKNHTLAIHFRSVPESGPLLVRALQEQRSAFAAADLQLLYGKAVVEIKPRWFNKGTGVMRLMRHVPFSQRTPVFVGDDATDEDVMRVLPEYNGVGYAVGREMPGAAFTFEAPGQVRSWLEALAAA